MAVDFLQKTAGTAVQGRSFQKDLLEEVRAVQS